MAKRNTAVSSNTVLTTPLALVLLFFLFLSAEFVFLQFGYDAMAWLTGFAFAVAVLAVVASSGAMTLEYKFVRTNERPKPPPQKLTVELPQTVQHDPAWDDQPVLEAEFSEQPRLAHNPQAPANFAEYRQRRRVHHG